VTVVEGSFPEAFDASATAAEDAVLVLACAFTAPEAKYRAFEMAVARFGAGVIDFARLFTPTDDRAEWR
jgi:hypothetical protein